jgi:hypothetical protein
VALCISCSASYPIVRIQFSMVVLSAKQTSVEERRRASFSGTLSVGLLGGFAGGLEDDPSGHLDGVVGEAFVEPAQQGYVDRGCHSVLPLMVH